jgi:hypothetical protein
MAISAKLTATIAKIREKYSTPGNAMTEEVASELIARVGASTWGVFNDVYPEFNPPDKFWSKLNPLVS